MPLSDDDRKYIEDIIQDLHFTSMKWVETEKDTHKTLFQMNIEEVIDFLERKASDIADDPQVYNYKLHVLIALQLYELIKIIEENEEEND